MLQDQSQQPTRRKFYAAFVNLLGGAAAAIIAVPAAVYLLFKPKSPGAGTMVEVANLADLEPGVPKEIVYHRIEQLIEKKGRMRGDPVRMLLPSSA